MHKSADLKLSLLDRLLDDEPDKLHEKFKTRQQQLTSLYHSIHRDLENLLNTRADAILKYGMPDLFNQPPTVNYATEFVDNLRRIITVFEPRLKNVEVSLVQQDDPADSTLRFRITGWLQTGSAPALVTLDSTLNPENYAFQLAQPQDF